MPALWCLSLSPGWAVSSGVTGPDTPGVLGGKKAVLTGTIETMQSRDLPAADPRGPAGGRFWAPIAGDGRGNGIGEWPG
jgi:hypothetical protein